MTAPPRAGGWMGTFLLTALLILLTWTPLIVALDVSRSAIDVNSPLFAFSCFSGLAVFVAGASFAVVPISGTGVSELSWLLIGLLAVLSLHAASAFGIHRTHVLATGGGRLRDSFRAAGRSLLATARYSFVAVIALATFHILFLVVTLPDLLLAWPLAAFLIGLFAARYWLALPAIAIEGLGCRAALRRSRLLTGGIRVRILGLVLLLVLGTVGVLAAALPLLEELPGAAFAVTGALVGAARALAQARLYHDRVRVLEPPPVDELNRVFE